MAKGNVFAVFIQSNSWALLLQCKKPKKALQIKVVLKKGTDFSSILPSIDTR